MSPILFYSLKIQLNKWILIWSTTCADIYQSGNKSIQILFFFPRVLFWIYLIRKFGSPPPVFLSFRDVLRLARKKNKIAASCNIRHFHRMSQPAKSIVKLVVDSRSNFALSLVSVCCAIYLDKTFQLAGCWAIELNNATALHTHTYNNVRVLSVFRLFYFTVLIIIIVWETTQTLYASHSLSLYVICRVVLGCQPMIISRWAKTKRICGPLPNRERETDQGFFFFFFLLSVHCVMFYLKFIIFQIVYNEEGDTTTHWLHTQRFFFFFF